MQNENDSFPISIFSMLMKVLWKHTEISLDILGTWKQIGRQKRTKSPSYLIHRQKIKTKNIEDRKTTAMKCTSGYQKLIWSMVQ